MEKRFTVTENGYGKRTAVFEYKLQTLVAKVFLPSRPVSGTGKSLARSRLSMERTPLQAKHRNHLSQETGSGGYKKGVRSWAPGRWPLSRAVSVLACCVYLWSSELPSLITFFRIVTDQPMGSITLQEKRSFSTG